MFAPFRLTLPARRTTSVVFASPHSGQAYPPGFLERAEIDERALRSSEDAFVDRLFDAAPSEGAPLIAAGASRAATWGVRRRPPSASYPIRSRPARGCIAPATVCGCARTAVSRSSAASTTR